MWLLLIASLLLNVYLLEYTIKGRALSTAVSVYKVIKEWGKIVWDKVTKQNKEK